MNRSIFKNLFLIFIVCFLLAGLAGCALESLHEGLDERDANEIIVLLDENGIKSQKLRVQEQRKTTFKVLVKRKDLQKARKLLIENNLPRQKGTTLGDLFKQDELIPTETAERAKYITGLQGELAETIARIDGVVDVRVHINIPEPDLFSDDPYKKRPSASVLVKYIPDQRGEPPFEKKEMAHLVGNAVEGLDVNDVSIVLTPVRERSETGFATKTQGGIPTGMVSFGPLKVAQESKGVFKAIFAIFILLIAALSGGLAFVIYQLQMTGMAGRGAGGGSFDARYRAQHPEAIDAGGRRAAELPHGEEEVPDLGEGAEEFGFGDEDAGGDDFSLGG